MSFNQIPCPFIIPFSTREHNSQVLPYILWNIRSLLFLQDFSTQFFCLMYHIELGNFLLFARTMHITQKSPSIALPNSCTILSEGPSSSKEITGHTCSTQIFPEFLESSHKSKFHTSQFFVRCIIIHGRNECYLV